MDFTPTTETVVYITIRLSEAEARAILADPEPFQADLRAQLSGAARDKAPAKPHRREAPTGGDRPLSDAAGASTGHKRGWKFKRQPCPVCERRYASNWIMNHIAKHHPEYDPARAAEDQSAAPIRSAPSAATSVTCPSASASSSAAACPASQYRDRKEPNS